MKFIIHTLLFLSLFLSRELYAQCSVSISAQHSTCFNTCDGFLIANPTNGAQPYSYLWDAAAGSQASQMASGLCDGSYSVTITDNNGCTATATEVITSPPPMNVTTTQTNATCFGLYNGSASIVNVAGGTPPFVFLWSNGAIGSSISGLSSGFYTVTVTDMNGCSGSSSITVSDTACPVTLRGVVKRDTNNNCLPDSIEASKAAQILKITNQNTGYTGYTSTNASGMYSSRLDTGTYTVELIPPFGPYWNVCLGPQTVTIDSIHDVDTVDWALESIVDCPLLSVDITAPFIRLAGGGSHYRVYYCNNGTAPAYDAYVEVTIDSALNVIGSTIPISNQIGDWFRFDLDTIYPGECGSFRINIIPDSNVIIGQTHCTEAHIYPDSLCLPAWSGPFLNASGNCQNDTIYFKIENIGSSMMAASNYNIFEDDVIIHMGPFNLPAGDSIVIMQLATPGKTYRIEAPQAAVFPTVLGPPNTFAVVQSCNLLFNGGFNTGFVTPFYTNNTTPFIDIDCQPNRASYDPNDKAAQPEGYGSQHYITASNIPLEYRVRFQNTGTDTAFNIVIIDTLSSHVDPTTLQMGASSHTYNWKLSDEGILTVNFPDILLVDSNTNEPLSHGFFNYKIQQMPSLPIGTVINNQAAIYFDFNPPIFTNTTFHTIGENFVSIVLKMDEIGAEDAPIYIYPNPTSGIIHIEKSMADDLTIHVVDNLGRVVMQQTIYDLKTSMDLNQLPSGIYYLHTHNSEQQHVQKLIKY